MKAEMKTKKYSIVFWCIILATSLISAVIMTRITPIEVYELLKLYIIVILFLGTFELISISNQLPFFNIKEYIFDLCVGYILSSILVCIDVKLPIYFIWMFGSIYIAKKVHPYVGIYFQLIFSFLLCSIHAYGIEIFIYNFMIGCILCLLIQYADTLMSFFYVFVIVGSMQVILTLVVNNFIFRQSISMNVLCTVLSGWILVILGYFIRPKRLESDKDIFTEIEENESLAESYETVESLTPSQFKQEEVQEDYSRFITSDAPLMKRLNEEKPNTYRHSLLIGILSEKAATKIGANESLAKAGGLYHEIGKLEEGNYIEEGVLLATKHSLPNPLINIIRQQNGKMDKPDSKESVIVMLTDSIISTIKYFEKQPKEQKRSNEKIINDIFRVRLDQGVLDKASLSITEFQTLKEFYHSNLPKGGKNDNNI